LRSWRRCCRRLPGAVTRSTLATDVLAAGGRSPRSGRPWLNSIWPWSWSRRQAVPAWWTTAPARASALPAGRRHRQPVDMICLRRPGSTAGEWKTLPLGEIDACWSSTSMAGLASGDEVCSGVGRVAAARLFREQEYPCWPAWMPEGPRALPVAPGEVVRCYPFPEQAGHGCWSSWIRHARGVPSGGTVCVPAGG